MDSSSTWLAIALGVIGLGGALMSGLVPALFPHHRMLFFWLSVILVVVGFGGAAMIALWPKKPTPQTTETPKPDAGMVFVNTRGNQANRITHIGQGTAIRDEGGQNNVYSDVNMIDPTAVAKPGEIICWALRDSGWVTFATTPDKIPEDVDGCMNPETGEIESAHEIAKRLKRGPYRPSE